jgi:hypothetical protein
MFNIFCCDNVCDMYGAGAQCFCDNANFGRTPAPDSECNMPCNSGVGDDGAMKHSTEMCGGAWRNSIYKAST